VKSVIIIAIAFVLLIPVNVFAEYYEMCDFNCVPEIILELIPEQTPEPTPEPTPALIPEQPPEPTPELIPEPTPEPESPHLLLL